MNSSATLTPVLEELVILSMRSCENVIRNARKIFVSQIPLKGEMEMRKTAIILCVLSSFFVGTAYAQDGEIGFFFANASDSPIYANGNSGNWDEVAYGPQFNNTPVVPHGPRVGGPLLFNQNGAAGYAITTGSGPNLTNVQLLLNRTILDSCYPGAIQESNPLDNIWAKTSNTDGKYMKACVFFTQPAAGMGRVEASVTYNPDGLPVITLTYHGP